MAKTKIKSPASRNRADVLHGTNKPLLKPKSEKSIPTLLAEAATHLTQSQPELALPLASSAVSRLQSGDEKTTDVSLPAALCLLAEINLELGDADTARSSYQRAVELDPQRSLGAEVWFSLAQLSEVGGAESIRLYETGAEILRKGLANHESEVDDDDEENVSEAKARLADALCAMTEVYMTDLSWEADAEARCEAYITEAVATAPGSASVLQTLASVRISQERTEEARSALKASMECWSGPWGLVQGAEEEGEEEDDEDIPDFPTRISLVRLLMEVQLEAEALVVLDRLVREDDESVEAWYLSGWGRVLLADKGGENAEKRKVEARQCLATALRLYGKLEYEDEPLKVHAMELMQRLQGELGGEDGEWEDEDEDDDEDGRENVENEEDDDIITNEEHDHDGDVDMT